MRHQVELHASTHASYEAPQLTRVEARRMEGWYKISLELVVEGLARFSPRHPKPFTRAAAARTLATSRPAQQPIKLSAPNKNPKRLTPLASHQEPYPVSLTLPPASPPTPPPSIPPSQPQTPTHIPPPHTTPTPPACPPPNAPPYPASAPGKTRSRQHRPDTRRALAARTS